VGGNSSVPIGRKTICTPDRIKRIAEVVRAGNYAQVAARASGICPGTYFGWMKKGEDAIKAAGDGGQIPENKQPYVDFFHAIKDAEAEAELAAVANVQLAGETDWKASMTFLERRFSQRWARLERREHSTGEGEAINVSVTVTGDVDEGATGP